MPLLSGPFRDGLEQHKFLTGIDYTDDHFVLPLNLVVIIALVIGAVLVSVKRWIPAGAVGHRQSVACCGLCLPPQALSS